MKIKKVKIEVCKGFSPHNYIYLSGVPKNTECDIRINVFYGKGRYFFFYSGLFKKRRLKRNTWLLELILNRDKYLKESNTEHVIKPLRILEGVTKEEGRYKYEEICVSPYLMRRLLEQSTNPRSFKDLVWDES